MGAISNSAVTSFNAPNYVGELFLVSPTDTPFLSAIGGLTGGESVKTTAFTWATTDLRAADDTRQRVEGANAPQYEGRTLAPGYNVVEIHQEALSITYTKLAASAMYATSGIAQANAQVGGDLAINDELAFQVSAALTQIARDIDKTFLTGNFAMPTTNATARKTQGLIGAITTNVTAAAAAALTEKMVNDIAQLAYDNGGIAYGETRTIICNSVVKRNLTKLFLRDHNIYTPSTSDVGGVSVQRIMTDFGEFNIMLDRNMPLDTLVVASLEECAPVFLEIPDRGFLFLEPLAKTGAADNYQIYGEVGLDYGNQLKHAKITGLATAVL